MRNRNGLRQKALIPSEEEEQNKVYLNVEDVHEEEEKEEIQYAKERGPIRESVHRFRNIVSFFFLP